MKSLEQLVNEVRAKKYHVSWNREEISFNPEGLELFRQKIIDDIIDNIKVVLKNIK